MPGPPAPAPDRDRAAPARLLPYGDRAVLVEVDHLHEALALRDLLLGQPDEHPHEVPGLSDVVAGARTVLLVAASAHALPGVRDHAQRALTTLQEATQRVTPEEASTRARHLPSPDQVVQVPVHYDGDDLGEVGELCGLTVAQVVAAHTGTPWRVGFAGFAPGFAYLVDGDPRLRVPRRASPRPRVPSGAVGLADEFSGVYPRQSPGGWQLLGHTELTLWDVDRDPPALLRPGFWVQFTDAGGGS
jgi:KipI family sensor histidine kinase inhibitor